MGHNDRGGLQAECPAVPSRVSPAAGKRKRTQTDHFVNARPPRVDTRIGRAGTPAVLKEEEVCLMPGEVVVRVEDAPGNARRIFTGIDIVAPTDVLEAVWRTLTQNSFPRPF